MHAEFLKLCGFDEEELEREKARIEEAFKILGLETEDLKAAEERVRKYFDVGLEGMRKVFHILLKELINLVLARREKRKVIYGEWPLPAPILLAMMKASDDVYVGMPGTLLSLTMGQIFNKLTPILEAGEENGLPPGSAHCALYQTHLGAISKGIIPIPDLLITPGYFCDIPAEAGQLMHEVFGVPTIYFDGMIDSQWGDYPKLNLRLLEYTGKQTDNCIKKFEETTGYTVTDEMRRDAIRDNARVYYVYEKLMELEATDPQPVSQTNIGLAGFLVLMPLKNKDGVNQAVETLFYEVQQRVNEGKGILPKGTPRVYCTFNSVVDPAIVKVVEEAGVSIPILFFIWRPPMERSIKVPYKTLGEKAAAACVQRPGFGSIDAMLEGIKEVADFWKVDGVIEGAAYSCRPMAVRLMMIKKVLREKLGIPVLTLESDYYDTRNYSAQQLRTRIETFAEMLKMAKASKLSGA